MSSRPTTTPPIPALRFVKHAFVTFMVLLVALLIFMTHRLTQQLHEQQQQLDQKYRQQNHRQLAPKLLSGQQPQAAQSQPQLIERPPVRVLFGIFSYDGGAAYRRKFRELWDQFQAADDFRVCSLYEFENALWVMNQPDKADFVAKHRWVYNTTLIYQQCSFVYTFVIGGNPSPDAPYAMYSHNNKDILYTVKPTSAEKFTIAKDVWLQREKKRRLRGDMTFLNIQENMNFGKSPTWFHYASNIVAPSLPRLQNITTDTTGDISSEMDYIAKLDSDALPYMDLFFEWAIDQHRLPPAPFNQNILVGNPVDKYWWWTEQQQQQQKVPNPYDHGKNYSFNMDPSAVLREDFWVHHYHNHMHLYTQGQCYILSVDLAQFVAKEAASLLEHNITTANSSGWFQEFARRADYREGHEDHDVSAMAFHAPNPVQFQLLNRYQKFWLHPIKRAKGYKMMDTWNMEIERMAQEWLPLSTNKAMPGYWKDADGILHATNKGRDRMADVAED